MRVVAFDTETKGLDWWKPEQQAFLATWADADGEYAADLSNPDGVREFLAALDGAEVVVAHNLSFDAHQVKATLGYDVLDGRVCMDTDLMSRVLYPEGQRAGAQGGHGLKNLAKVFLRADATDPEDAIKEMAKSIGLKTIKQTGAYFDVWRAYPEVMEEYAKQDARYTYDLYTKFSGAINGYQRILTLEHEVAPILIRAEERGIKTDQDAVAKLKCEYTERKIKVMDYLEQELGFEALSGSGSEAALLEALQAIGVPLHRKTPSGQLATHKFALQEFEHDFPQIAALQEYRQLEKFLSTYIGPLEGVDVVHPSFKQCGAWTGRMSCTRPNMQNIPKRAGSEVRNIFVPRPGTSFVVCDYESIEVRLLAYYLNDPGFIQLIEEGHDPHAWMAAQIWGGDPLAFGKGTAGESRRSIAKNILFAITYGAGAPRVRDMLRDADMPATTEAAKSIIASIKSSLPNYYKLNKRIRNKVEAEGYVTTLFGRKQPVNKDKAYVGLNALIQGSAADIMKQGLVNVAEACDLTDSVPLLVVHDEIVVECPTENANEMLVSIGPALSNAVGTDFRPRLSVSGCVVHNHYGEAA